MSNKRVNYMELLKESVGDRGHDTTDTVDVNGPFLDPILGYDGGGELPTHKDASSILERYYFNQAADKGVRVTSEGEAPEQDPVAKTGAHETSGRADKDGKSGSIENGKSAAKKEIAKEDEYTIQDGDVLEEDELLEDEVENAVIERLIAEMEEDEVLEEGEAPEQDPVGKTKVHEPSGLPNKDKSGLIDGDKHEGGEGAVKPATFPAGGEEVSKGLKEDDLFDLDSMDDLLEADDAEDITAGGEETPEETPDKKREAEGEDLDVDKEEVKEAAMGPLGHPHDAESYDELEEAFNIFTEDIEGDDVPDLDDDDIVV